MSETFEQGWAARPFKEQFPEPSDREADRLDRLNCAIMLFFDEKEAMLYVEENEQPSALVLHSALSAVTAERDRLREAFGECIQSLHDEMLQSYGGQKPDDMHPVTRRNYDRDMAEIAEYRAAMAAKEA